MKLKILTWNVRGLNAADKQMVVRSFLRDVKADVICLQKTKKERAEGDWVKEIWGGRFLEWECLSARGASGGILICWDRRVVAREDVEIGGYSVTCLFKCIEDDLRWAFTGVYGPTGSSKRGEFFDELVSVAFRWEVP